MDLSFDDFAQVLVERIPEFAAIYEQHLQDYDGEVLSHPLMAEFLRFTIAVFQDRAQTPSPSQRNEDLLCRIFRTLEDAATSDDERLTELVQVSFMENLPQAGTYESAIRSRLGPGSLALLEAAEKGWNAL